MGVSSSAFKDIRNRYSQVFGPFNQQVVIHNHTFLLIDAPGLVDEDYQRAAYGVGYDKWTPLPDGTAAFVKSVKRDQNPLILLSHIPLARPDSASCGPLREKGTIRRGVGHGYQNTLGKQTTAFLLQSIRPSTGRWHFSGDNRDYCEYTHVAKKTQSSDIREVTVKSFSLAKHIHHPGFQLLSLVNPTNDVTDRSFLDAPCTLPDQFGIYSRVYFPFFLFTWFTVFILALWRRRYRKGFRVQPLKLTPHSSGHSTPDDPPESAIWSPYTPGFGSSPRGTLPSSIRTPTTLAHPTYRASRPTTPLGTPLLPPTYYSHDDDDDDAMLPPQYAARKENGNQPEDHEWPSGGHHKLDSETTIPHFTPPPGAKHKHSHHGWSYSWSFVFRGRRRRMTVSLPALSIRLLKDLAELFKGEQRSPARHHHVLRTAVGDGLRIFAVVGVFWVLLSWHWMF
ncbi:hypothetical protein H0H93_002295 [Arthromyces matolae]|nr:hypothetical protein H0H93_002295 [Arthromyces matolae]